MKIKSTVFIFFIVFVLTSCREKAPDREINAYFDLKGLIDDQIELLVERDAKLERSAILSTSEESSISKPDSLGWSDQLQLFRSADLNRPILVDAYDVIDGVKSPTSNLLIKKYVPLDPEKVNIREFNIHYLDQPSNIRILEITEQEENELYSSKRKMKMEFDQIDGEIILEHYSIESIQEMRTLDSVTFKMVGKIVY